MAYNERQRDRDYGVGDLILGLGSTESPMSTRTVFYLTFTQCSSKNLMIFATVHRIHCLGQPAS